MNSTRPETPAPAAEPASQPARGRLTDSVRDIRDDLQARITALLRNLNI
jgi:hypothetical protein